MSDTVTKIKRWTRRPEGSNWGEFGEDDQVGRLNLITPEMRLAAAAEIREGLCFPLSLPLDYPGGEAPDAYRVGPKLFVREIDGEPLYNRQLGRLVVPTPSRWTRRR